MIRFNLRFISSGVWGVSFTWIFTRNGFISKPNNWFLCRYCDTFEGFSGREFHGQWKHLHLEYSFVFWLWDHFRATWQSNDVIVLAVIGFYTVYNNHKLVCCLTLYSICLYCCLLKILYDLITKVKMVVSSLNTRAWILTHLPDVCKHTELPFKSLFLGLNSVLVIVMIFWLDVTFFSVANVHRVYMKSRSKVVMHFAKSAKQKHDFFKTMTQAVTQCVDGLIHRMRVVSRHSWREALLSSAHYWKKQPVYRSFDTFLNELPRVIEILFSLIANYFLCLFDNIGVWDVQWKWMTGRRRGSWRYGNFTGAEVMRFLQKVVKASSPGDPWLGERVPLQNVPVKKGEFFSQVLWFIVGWYSKIHKWCSFHL